MRKWPVVGVVLAGLWLFVSGVEVPAGPPVAVAEALVGALLVGTAVGMPIAYVTRRMYADEFVISRSVRTAPAVVRYLASFLFELATANVDVAYRVLSPSMPIDPDVVEVPLRVRTDAAITSIANSITLTPGTLTMDYDEATNTLYVHAIAGKDDYFSVVDPIRAWEDLALVIFDEELGPDDPIPDTSAPTASPGREPTPDAGHGGQEAGHAGPNDGGGGGDGGGPANDGGQTDARGPADGRETVDGGDSGGE